MGKLMDEITNSREIIDSREVIARIEEIEPWHVEHRDQIVTDVATFKTEQEALGWIAEQEDRAPLSVYEDGDESRELHSLTELAAQGKSLGDWRNGETLICDYYFEEYAQELASDLGLINDEQSWPFTCIDWEEAADQLKMDYTAIDFGGVTYWARA
jgi:hypothetical protein